MDSHLGHGDKASRRSVEGAWQQYLDAKDLGHREADIVSNSYAAQIPPKPIMKLTDQTKSW